MTSPLTVLQNSLTVTPLDDNQVRVTVTLSADLFPDYVHLLEALTGFVRSIQVKANRSRRSFEIRADSFDLSSRDQFYERVVRRYDQLTAQGLLRSQAIKQISIELRKEDHPWSAVDLVRCALSDAGRPGQPGRPRRSS